MLNPGARLGPYEIVASLGAGGMGEVYRARDARLGRDVAIKVLPAVFAADPDRLRRFELEARATAALSHPNILSVFDVGSHDGSPYLVEELLEGETLRARLASGSLPCRKAVEIATQVAHGLAAAHARGIVHRDLKPENVFLTRDGVVKILDFGLATLVRGEGETDLTAASTATSPQAVLGTAGYMSPEQVRGQTVDARSDLFSLGVVLYEMLSGRSPFRRTTPADTASAILREDPPPLLASVHTCPPPLDTVVRRCLEKRPEDRFSSAHDLAIALEASSWPQPPPADTTEAGAPLRSPRPSHGRRLVLVGAAAAALIAIVLAGWRLLLPARAARPDFPTERQVRIVVLPFENLGAAEEAYFASGMAEEITSRLANVRGLGVISRTTAVSYDRAGKTVTQIGADLGVDYVLEGTVRWEHGQGAGGRVRITPQLIRTADDTHVWTARYDRVLADVFAIQSEVAESAVTAMGVTLLPGERETLAGISTTDLEAYDFFLRGREIEARGFARSEVEGALEMYRKAVDRDPRFAQALAQLARQHLQMYWLHYDRSESHLRSAREAAELAVELRPDLTEPHVAVGFYFYQAELDYPRALAAFAAAREIQPDNGDALAGTAFVVRRQGRWAESAELLARAVEGDPNNVYMLSNLGQSLELARRYAEADRTFDRAIQQNPRWISSYRGKADVQLVWHGVDRMLAVLEDGSRAPELTEEQRSELREDVAWLDAEARRDVATRLELLRAWGDEAQDGQFIYEPAALTRGMLELAAGRADRGRSSFEAARADLEERIAEDPGDGRFHSALGVAYAGLGRAEDAVREARLACDLVPPSKEAWQALYLLENLAKVYTMTGREAEAIATLDDLLARSGIWTPHVLRLDATWDPLRDDTRFQALLAKYEVRE